MPRVALGGAGQLGEVRAYRVAEGEVSRGSIVERREAGYRYLPLARSIAGGPRGGEDDNWCSSTFTVSYTVTP